MMKYLEEVPETVVGVKLGRRPELNWLSLPSPLTKNIVFLFFLNRPTGATAETKQVTTCLTSRHITMD